MAEKRMFAKTIVLSDEFLDMPATSRCLYFTLSMLADDDGFVNNPKSIMRQCSATQDDLAILLTKRFVLGFDDGVLVIKHWRINNYLRADRYTPTKYTDQMNQLIVEDNGAYTEKDLGIPVGIPVGIPSIDKNRLDKNSKEILSSNEEAKEIIDYLNSKCNTRYRANTESTRKHINARLKEGYTVEDFKQVIDTKVAEWGKDTKMRKFLRPETLFGTKFEGYLNQSIPTKTVREYGENGVVAEW